MVMRVSTFAQTSTVLQNALETQAKLAENTEQQSSGILSDDYAGLGSDATKLVDLEVSISRSEASISAAETTQTRVETIYSTLGSISDLLTSMRSAVTSVSTEDDLSSLQTTAESSLDELVSLLNTQLAGRYLFAGSNTETAPVDASTYEATDLTTTDTSYYTGDSYTQSVRLNSDWTIEYGVTADNEAIEEALRAISYAATSSTLTTDDIDALSELLISAQDGIIALQSMASSDATALKNYISSEESYVADLEEVVSDINSADVVALTVEASSYEVQLQASYTALGKLADLSIREYLF